MRFFEEVDVAGNVVRSGFTLGLNYVIPDGHAIRPYEPTLVSIKASKRAQIEQWRDDVCTGGVSAKVGNAVHSWQSDSRSQAILGNCITLASTGAIPCPAVWRTADNVNVSVTLDDLKLIAGTIAYVTQQAFSHSWDLKGLLDASTTQAEVDAITW